MRADGGNLFFIIREIRRTIRTVNVKSDLGTLPVL
jgi:hypothetical protein